MKRDPDILESEATAAPLWAAARLARTTDPATAKEAARAIVGDLPRLHAEALAAVRSHPDRTARELEEMGHVPRSTYGRRLPELALAGKVARCPARRCAITGRMAETWVAVENDRSVT